MLLNDKRLSMKKSPQPPFTKGGLHMGFLTGKRLSPPFSKAARLELVDKSRRQVSPMWGPRGILLRGRLPEEHCSILTVQA
jgi:hypothetical protein